ncbi:hypothetical protein K439DRAFT_1633754 [Ramaria rubella]|nr:hypothetical protein K439DRAFT_1633754 [Ramaria rubella]
MCFANLKAIIFDGTVQDQRLSRPPGSMRARFQSSTCHGGGTLVTEHRLGTVGTERSPACPTQWYRTVR